MSDEQGREAGEALTDEQREAHRERMQALREEHRRRVAACTERRGVLIINTGNGKGKSTSAFGTVLRAVGHGFEAGVVQFIKGKWKTGEMAALRLLPGVEHIVAGDGFTWDTQDLDRDIASARRGWSEALRLIEAARANERFQLLVLDELNIALRYGYLDPFEVARGLIDRPEHLSIIVTGRDAPEALIEVADTVTTMQPVKHAFEAGIRARRGVEF